MEHRRIELLKIDMRESLDISKLKLNSCSAIEIVNLDKITEQIEEEVNPIVEMLKELKAKWSFRGNDKSY